MSQNIDYLFTDREEVINEVPAIESVDGICSKCLDTGYIMTNRSGLLGVLYSSTFEDAEGKPVKRLVHCECRISTDY